MTEGIRAPIVHNEEVIGVVTLSDGTSEMLIKTNSVLGIAYQDKDILEFYPAPDGDIIDKKKVRESIDKCIFESREDEIINLTGSPDESKLLSVDLLKLKKELGL